MHRLVWLTIFALIGIGYLGWVGYAMAEPMLVVYGPPCSSNTYTLVMPKAPAAYRIITGLATGDCIRLKSLAQADQARAYCASERKPPSDYARSPVLCEGDEFKTCKAPPVVSVP